MYNPFSFKTPEGCLTCTTCIKSPDILMGLRLTHAVLQESSVDYDKILGLLETYFASLEQLLKSDLLDHILYRALTHLSIFAFKSGTHWLWVSDSFVQSDSLSDSSGRWVSVLRLRRKAFSFWGLWVRVRIRHNLSHPGYQETMIQQW